MYIEEVATCFGDVFDNCLMDHQDIVEPLKFPSRSLNAHGARNHCILQTCKDAVIHENPKNLKTHRKQHPEGLLQTLHLESCGSSS